MRRQRTAMVVLFVAAASSVTAQDLKINVPYQCRDGKSQMRVTNCFGRPEACDVESLKDGKWEAFIRASKPTIANAIRQCVGPDSPNAPAAPPPLRPGPTTAVTPSSPAGPSTGLTDTTDPGTLAARRCAASGRTLSDCFAEVFATELGKFIPGVAPKRPVPGVRLAGIYRAPRVSIEIVNDVASGLQKAAVLKCGKLEPILNPITLSPTGALPAADVKKTIPLAFRPDGTIRGPKDFLVEGLVIVGYGAPQSQTVTVQDGAVPVQRSIGTPVNLSDPNTFYYEPRSHTETRSIAQPIYAPATDRCDFTSLALTQDRPVSVPASPVVGRGDPNRPIASNFGLASGMTLGLSMVGDYMGAGGFSITFRTDSATVNCGNAQVADKYRVEPDGTQTVIRLTNSGNPFAMILQPNGSLVPAMPGAVTVAGRVMTGMNGPQPIYAARTARCQLATVSPVAP